VIILTDNLNIPPYKIKMVEPINLIPKKERQAALKRAGYNLFALRSEEVFIDLLTDSGTNAMSDNQWAGIMSGDESYAGSRNFFHLKDTVQDIFNYSYMVPTHQGRGAEQVLFPLLVDKDNYVLSNMHFDTTKAHVELAGGKAKNFIIAEALNTDQYHPFKGNFDINGMEKFIQTQGKNNISLIIITITCNSAGGQPVSMDNIRKVSSIAKKYNIPIIMDAARFAENAFFIKSREKGYEDKSIKDIIREMFSYTDAFTMSAKKDAIVNIGGMIGIKDDEILYNQIRSQTIPLEGFPTYGGLAGRDLEAISRGLQEGIQYPYLKHRINQISLLGKKLLDNQIPVQYPVGGHAVFVDAKKFLPHIPFDQFPAQALANELYLEGGIRGVEIGSLLLGRDPKNKKQLKSPFEFLRLTIPRRVYTDAHLNFTAESLINIKSHTGQIKGLEFSYEPKILRHFTARLKPISS